MTTTDTKPVTPLPFVEAVLGYQKTAAIKAALELGLFEAIDAGGTDAETIAGRVGASARGVRILCDYLTILGFLDKAGSLWRQTAVTAAFIDRRSPTSMASVARFLAGPEFLDLFLDDPADYVRRGGTEGLANMAPEDPVWVTFAQSMTPFTVAAAKAMAEHVALWPNQPRRVLDIAAGAGMFGISVARSCPSAHVVGVDWRDVIAIAGQNAERAGVAARYQTVPGDAFKVAWGTGFDLVLLPNILHHFDHDTCVALLNRIRESLAPGGRALIIEFIPDEDRISPPVPASFAFMMMATTQHGDAFTATEYAAMARDAGLRAGPAVPLPPSQERLMELFV
jgi:2-polyprenyl-3-methyl-5-hydroxy-6-metoxy-1,4-benzoquinol methylase